MFTSFSKKECNRRIEKTAPEYQDVPSSFNQKSFNNIARMNTVLANYRNYRHVKPTPASRDHSSHIFSKENIDLKNLYKDPVEKQFTKKQQNLDRDSKVLKEQLKMMNSNLSQPAKSDSQSQSTQTTKDIMGKLKETVEKLKPTPLTAKGKQDAIQRVRQRPALQLNSSVSAQNQNMSKKYKSMDHLLGSEEKIMNVSGRVDDQRMSKSPILNSVKKVIGNKSITKYKRYLEQSFDNLHTKEVKQNELPSQLKNLQVSTINHHRKESDNQNNKSNDNSIVDKSSNITQCQLTLSELKKQDSNQNTTTKDSINNTSIKKEYKLYDQPEQQSDKVRKFKKANEFELDSPVSFKCNKNSKSQNNKNSFSENECSLNQGINSSSLIINNLSKVESNDVNKSLEMNVLQSLSLNNNHSTGSLNAKERVKHNNFVKFDEKSKQNSRNSDKYNSNKSNKTSSGKANRLDKKLSGEQNDNQSKQYAQKKKIEDKYPKSNLRIKYNSNELKISSKSNNENIESLGIFESGDKIKTESNSYEKIFESKNNLSKNYSDKYVNSNSNKSEQQSAPSRNYDIKENSLSRSVYQSFNNDTSYGRSNARANISNSIYFDAEGNQRESDVRQSIDQNRQDSYQRKDKLDQFIESRLQRKFI